jgi:hypothetical protein
MKTVKLSTFIENPDNPQTVAAEDFAQLVESLRTMRFRRARSSCRNHSTRQMRRANHLTT